MKITKDTQTVWKLDNEHTIVGTSFCKTYYVRNQYGIMECFKSEMIKMYGLTKRQFAKIEKSGI